MSPKKYHSIDEYHADFPKDIRDKLNIFRKIIQQTVPGAGEEISYNMPAFRQNAVFVYYSAFKKHISLFPAPCGKEWEREFKPYKTSGRGTIQFPYSKPIPADLVTRIVMHLASRDAEKKKEN